MTDEFTVDVEVRYQDLDTFEHVNNAVYATYLEQARVAYLEEVLEMDVESYSFVLAGLELSFQRSITLEDDVTVVPETTAIGETSWTMSYDIRANGETAATGETTQVFVDRDTKRPTPIPPETRRRLVDFEGLEA